MFPRSICMQKKQRVKMVMMMQSSLLRKRSMEMLVQATSESVVGILEDELAFLSRRPVLLSIGVDGHIRSIIVAALIGELGIVVAVALHDFCHCGRSFEERRDGQVRSLVFCACLFLTRN